MYSSSAKNNYEKTERFSRTSLKRFEITLEKRSRDHIKGYDMIKTTFCLSFLI